MKTPIILFFLALGHFTFAQEEPEFPDMRSWMIRSGDTTDRYIFADTALIRVLPDTKQPPIDTLCAGDNITVTSIVPNPLTIRGLKGPWLKIKYIKNGELKKGYVWQGLVGCTPLRRGNIKFVYGIERRADSSYMLLKTREHLPRLLVRLKVVQNGKVLTTAAFPIYDAKRDYFLTGKTMSGMGLSNVQHIIAISNNRKESVILSEDYYFALTKSGHLVRFPDKSSSFEARIVNRRESFIFPNEKNGKPDMIIWKMIMEETTNEVDKNGEEIMEVTDRKNIVYTWDGVREKISGPDRN